MLLKFALEWLEQNKFIESYKLKTKYVHGQEWEKYASKLIFFFSKKNFTLEIILMTLHLTIKRGYNIGDQ